MPNNTTSPFDDIRDLISNIPNVDNTLAQQVQEKLENAFGGLKPLGHLDRAVSWLAKWQDRAIPQINKPLLAVFMGTHGVAKSIGVTDIEGLAKTRLDTMSTNGAIVRGIASAQGASFKVYEMGLSVPSANMRVEASLSERECAAAIAFGMEVVAEGADIIALGCTGIGSATAAAGIARGLYGGASSYWAGGHDEYAQARIQAVDDAASCHREILGDPLEVLRCFGGRDIAGLVGAILAAGHQKIPILLDGFVVCAAAAIVHEINPKGLEHCLAAHLTTEPAHGALLDRLNKKPLMEYGVGIGDGSGAGLALGVIKAAIAGAAEL